MLSFRCLDIPGSVGYRHAPNHLIKCVIHAIATAIPCTIGALATLNGEVPSWKRCLDLTSAITA